VNECHYQLAFLEEITCTKTRKRYKSGGSDLNVRKKSVTIWDESEIRAV
jgi:hypothetical protein